ncbi:MAG: hypothetical protein IIB38_00535 [Candidatus Hydrogenedentes bacterium]|nr:hypothetical protein [Candidatus Hydrogenedentota bacterium]
MLIGGILFAFFIAIVLAYWVRTQDTSSPISSSTASKTLHAKQGTQRKGARALVRTKNLPAPSKGGHADPNDIEIWGSLEPGGYQADSPSVTSDFQALDKIYDLSFTGQPLSQISSVDTSAYPLPSFPEDDPDSLEPAQPVNETYVNAKRLFQKGEFGEAQRLLETLDTEDSATSLSSWDAENRVLLALTHSKQGHAEEGIALLRDIMQHTESIKGVRDDRLVQTYRQAALHLTRLLRAQGRRDEADSVRLDPAVVGSGSERKGSVRR